MTSQIQGMFSVLSKLCGQNLSNVYIELFLCFKETALFLTKAIAILTCTSHKGFFFLYVFISNIFDILIIVILTGALQLCGFDLQFFHS